MSSQVMPGAASSTSRDSCWISSCRERVRWKRHSQLHVHASVWPLLCAGQACMLFSVGRTRLVEPQASLHLQPLFVKQQHHILPPPPSSPGLPQRSGPA